jgi:hypothetical protein
MSEAKENNPAGCSKRPDFSPSQPWRAETRLVPSKAAGGARTGGVPSGYVEDSCELRTPLAVFFSSLLLRKRELGELCLVETLLH